MNKIYITDKNNKKLKIISAERGIKLMELADEIITDYLKKVKKK